MHGYNSGAALLVNAEVDSMGGVVDGGVGIGLKISPHRAAIERAQAELREEYDVREERRRELEFLEKGGNPLDFKYGNAASVSVQSTSITDQHHEQLVTSEAKGSFALTASPYGDSVDSSARPGPPSASEPNTADNLLLFDGENEFPESEKRSLHSNKRNNIAPSEQSSQIDGSQNAKETEDSAIFRPYARRNRSRSNHGSRVASSEGKGLTADTNNQKDHNVPSASKPKPASLNGDIINKNLTPNRPLNSELVGVRDHQSASGSAVVPKQKLDVTLSRNIKENHGTLPSQDDIVQNPVVMVSGEANAVEVREPVAAVDHEPPPHAVTTKPENGACYGQPNGFGNLKEDRKSLPNEGQNSIAELVMKNFNSESYCTQTSLGRDVNNDTDMCINGKNVDANGNSVEQIYALGKKLNFTGCQVVKDRNKIKSENAGNGSNEHDAGYQNHSGSDTIVKDEEDIHINSSCMLNIKGVHRNDSAILKADNDTVLVDDSNFVKDNNCERHWVPLDASVSKPPHNAPAEKVTIAASDYQPCSTNHIELADRTHEDSILEKARIVEAKRKRIAGLSIRPLPKQNHKKSHWDFVLEEMAWLANDFAQERLWKITAAAQFGHQAAYSCRLRFEKQNKHLGMKILSHRMARAVMQFWHSAELLLDSDHPGINCIDGSMESVNTDTIEASRDQRRNSDMEPSRVLVEQNPIKNAARKVHAYALRFLKETRSHGISPQADTPSTPEKIFDPGTVDMSWVEHLNEESLFYIVLPTAMETYRKSIEFQFLRYKKTGSSIQEEVETSLYDTAAEYGSEENAYDEDEGETSTYYLPNLYEGSKSSKSAQRKPKNWKSYTPRPTDPGTDLPYAHYTAGIQPSMIYGKRPPSVIVGSIPTKRMRTASRHKVVSPFPVNPGTVQPQAKTDASSGDTNSCPDDHSNLHVGPLIQKSMEVESVRDFEKQLSYEYAETSVKTKKKKKAKNLVSAYDQGWQVDSVINEQWDHSKKRLDSHHFESNGSSGLYGQHTVKKPKIMKQSLDNTFDNIAQMTNSITSPAASQMSNMSNPGKIIKIFTGRDRGRKAKAIKISSGQPGSGSSWSLFEDQALVVLVHDMGPNWELVSDAINSTLQFRCIFRTPKECKERHKILMDRNAGDGADSAEDSGSSQSYPSTLPGIPKGSARQLFQRLRGPMEEDTLKSHFEKIIKIGQKYHYLRNQNDNHDLKQLVPPHNSHVIALSQVFPNNLNGGVLTPLDLCDTNASNPDALAIGCQGSHAASVALSNQGSVPSILPASGVNSSLPGSSGMVLGNNLSSPSGPIAACVRDQYGVARSSALSVDEQQRIQHYNQLFAGRNIQQSSLSVPGTISGSDRGVRMLPGGNGMGLMSGINRSMARSRPGFQGMASPSMLNSGSMLSSSMAGMPNPMHMHSGVGAGQGNSMLRPRETLHMMRPGHNPEHQRQMMVPELHMQVTQGNSQGIPAFCGSSSAFSSQTAPSSVQTYPGNAQQPHQQSQQQSHLSNPHPQGLNHVTNSQQQALAVRLAKERQLHQQQRYLQHQQQQQQFAASTALMPHVQAQSQLPISSSPLQNSSQVQLQNSSQQVPVSPVTPSSPLTPMTSQHQQPKHHQPQHGLSRNQAASGLSSQTTKQRQRQPPQQQYQQPSRQHPNQRQNVQSQQQAKLLKGTGRGNMLVHQNYPVDPSHLNGLSVPSGSQTGEKGDQVMHVMQGQNVYQGSAVNSNHAPGSSLNPNQSSKPLVHANSSNHPHLQQKPHSGPTTTSSQQLQISSDNSSQVLVSPVPSGHMLSPPQPFNTSNHHQLQQQSQPQSKKINQTQSNGQRLLPQNCQVHSDSSSKSQSDPTLVDQQPANTASQVSTDTEMIQVCTKSTSLAPAITTVSSHRKPSEPPFDSNMNSATQVSSLGSATIESSTGNGQSTIGQGLGPRSVSLTSHAHNSVAQWQQQPQSLQSTSQPIPSPQRYQTPEQHKQQQQEPEQHSPKDLSLQHHSQQHVQHLQSVQGSLFMQAPNSKVE